MTVVARSTRDDTIFLPERLLTLLRLRDGDAVKAIVEGQTLRVARLEAFLNLRGALADDDAFDQAMKEVEGGWHAWTYPESA
jgi:antitoxin component of MazEF toxin-antitoxin module